MNRKTTMQTISIASALLISAFVVATPVARADEWNKKTVMTIDKPIQVPNKELPAGTYVVKLLSSESNRNIVQFFTADEKHLITTVLAIPNYRLQPTGKSKFTFWETPAGNAPALRAWFYPGDNFGQEFAYPKDMVTKLAASNKDTVPTVSEADQNSMQKTSSGDDTAAAASSTQATTPPNMTAGASQNSVTSTRSSATTDTTTAVTASDADRATPPPANQPAPVTPPAPPVTNEQPAMSTPQPTTTPQSNDATATTPTTGDADRSTSDSLPHTASDVPAVAAAGFASLLAFAGLTLLARKRRNA